MLHLPPVAAEIEVEQPRRGGRPKGLPKTGGRRPGVPNKLTQDQRLRIAKTADPIGFLTKVVKGKVRGMEVTPEMRVAAAVKLLERIIPPARPAEGDTDGGKIPIGHLDSSTTGAVDLGRRLAFVLTQADRAIAAAKEEGTDDDD